VYNRRAVATVETTMPVTATPVTNVPLLVFPEGALLSPEGDGGGGGADIGLSREMISYTPDGCNEQRSLRSSVPDTVPWMDGMLYL
jgi:hypothetical protein